MKLIKKIEALMKTYPALTANWQLIITGFILGIIFMGALIYLMFFKGGLSYLLSSF